MTEDIYNWLNTAGMKPDPNKVPLAISLVDEEVTELKQGLENNDRTEVVDAIVDIFWVALNTAYFYGISVAEIEEYKTKVSQSNWSKFCKSEAEAIETVNAYGLGTHPDKLGVKIETRYVKSGLFWIVINLQGKILKSINYKPVSSL